MPNPTQSAETPSPDYSQLLTRLGESEDTLRAIQRGDVDAVLMGGHIYSMRGAETPYRLLIEAMGEGACTVSYEGVVLYANHCLAELLEVPLSELISTPLRSWVNPSEQPVLDDWLIGAQQRTVGGDLQLQSRAGGSVPTHLSIKRLDLPDSQALGVVIVNLTEPKRVEASLRRSNRALQMVRACDHVLVHAESEADLLNEICQALVREGGYQLAWVGSAENDDAKTLLPRAHAGAAEAYLDKIHLSWAPDNQIQGPAGHAVQTLQPTVIDERQTDSQFEPWRQMAATFGFVASIGLPLRSEKGAWGALCIYSAQAEAFNAEEVTLLGELANDLAYGIATFQARAEHQKTEAQIVKLNAELEQRVNERTIELAAANNELEAFVYTVAHDLRAPLRSIDGFSRILVEDYGERLEQAGRDQIERVRTASQHMGKLIEGMLQLSRLSRGELRRTSVDLSARAQAILADLQSQEPERHVTVAVQPELKAQGDPNLVQSVMENLLGNAWKFTAKTAEARIEFGRTEKDGVDAFFVHDNGAGFNMEYQSKLFGVFQRLHRNDEFPGTGIGLASVKRIITRHGGRVWAESAPDTGTTFYFTLEPAPKP